MATTVFDYLQKVERAKKDLPNQVGEIIFKNETAILDLNRKKQLFEKGINKNGRIIGRYKKITEELSGGRKRAGEPFNFFDTGDFYRDFMYVYNPKKNTLEIFSKDNKTPILILRYSDNIFGLTPDNQKILNEEILLPNILKWLNSFL